MLPSECSQTLGVGWATAEAASSSLHMQNMSSHPRVRI